MAIDIASRHKQPAGIGVGDFIKILSVLMISGLLALNLMVVRPMRQKIESMESTLADVDSRMQMLVAERDQVRNTSDLLSMLKAQRGQIQEAYASIKSIRQFREDVDAEAAKVNEMLPSLQRLVDLENVMVQQRQLSEPAAQTLEEIAAMQRILAGQVHDVDEASRVLARMAETQRSIVDVANDAETAEIGLERLTELKRRVLSQSRGTEEARRRLDDIAAFNSLVIQEADDLTAAQYAAQELLNLKDTLVIRGAGIGISQHNADRLMDLRDRLMCEPNHSDVASRNLDLLIDLQEKLASIDGDKIVKSGPNRNFSMNQIVTAIEIRLRDINLAKLGMNFLEMEFSKEQIESMLEAVLRSLNIEPHQIANVASLQSPIVNVARTFAAVIAPNEIQSTRPTIREARNDRAIKATKETSTRPMQPTPARRVFWPMED